MMKNNNNYCNDIFIYIIINRFIYKTDSNNKEITLMLISWIIKLMKVAILLVLAVSLNAITTDLNRST